MKNNKKIMDKKERIIVGVSFEGKNFAIVKYPMLSSTIYAMANTLNMDLKSFWKKVIEDAEILLKELKEEYNKYFKEEEKVDK